MTNNDDPEIDRKAVAALLQCSVRTTYTYEDEGIISHGRVINRRGDRRWKRSEIEKAAKNFPLPD